MAQERNTITQAGDYQLEIVELISYRMHGGESKPYRMNIKPIVINIELTEDIFTNNMVGAITVYDTQDVRTILPITGLERLNLKFSTPGLPGVNANEEEGYPFQIYKIDEVRVDPENPRGQMYRIFFCSQEMYYSSMHRVSQAFAGPVEDAVDKIFRQKDYLNSQKPLFVEPTKTNTKLVIPNLRPLNAINLLSRYSVSGLYKNGGYVFYENPDGYFFRSIESMLAMGGAVARPAKFAYRYQTSNVRTGETRDINTDMRNVLKYDFVRPVNTLYNMREGMYANRLIMHDLFYKQVNISDYDYLDSFGDYFHVEHDEGNKANDLATIPLSNYENTNKDLSSAFMSKLLLSPQTSNIHNDYQMPICSDTKQQSLVQRLQLQNLNLNLLVFGNSLIKSGDIISFDVPMMRPLGEKKQDPNPYHSGRYLVMAIKHVINISAGRYEMVLKCMRDAVRTPLVSETENNAVITKESGIYNIYQEDSNILRGDILERT